MVTAGTLDKEHFFHTPERLDLLQDLLFSVAREFGWMLQAWAVLKNHYHFVANSPGEDATTLPRMISKLHAFLPGRSTVKTTRLDARCGFNIGIV